MSLIDVAIPAIGGLVLLLMPIKGTGMLDEDEKKRKRLRFCGAGLLVVALIYSLVVVIQPAA